MSERFKCDKSAIVLVLKDDFTKDAAKKLEYTAGHAFGIFWGTMDQGGLALNWMINDELKLRMVKLSQQLDIIYPPPPTNNRVFDHMP